MSNSQQKVIFILKRHCKTHEGRHYGLDPVSPNPAEGSKDGDPEFPHWDAQGKIQDGQKGFAKPSLTISTSPKLNTDSSLVKSVGFQINKIC